MNRTRFPYEDLIFENRNKAYGAYDLRVNYEVNLMKAFFIGLGSLTIISIMIYWINRPGIPEIIFKENSKIDLSENFVIESSKIEEKIPVQPIKKTRTIAPPSPPIDPNVFQMVKGQLNLRSRHWIHPFHRNQSGQQQEVSREVIRRVH